MACSHGEVVLNTVLSANTLARDFQKFVGKIKIKINCSSKLPAFNLHLHRTVIHALAAAEARR
jgi:hypothetical protein